MTRLEKDRTLIREFFYLIENESYDLRKYHKPVLVYKTEGFDILYSLWEEDLLTRFGVENIIGWDYKVDSIYAPDWMQEEDDEEEFEEDDEDFDDEEF